MNLSTSVSAHAHMNMFTGDFTLLHTYVRVYLQDTYECLPDRYECVYLPGTHERVLCMTGAVFKGLGSLLRMRGVQSAQESRGAQSLHDDTKVSNSWMPQLQRPTTKSAAAAEPAAAAAAMSEAVAPRAAFGTPNMWKEMYISIKRRINKTRRARCCSSVSTAETCGRCRALGSVSKEMDIYEKRPIKEKYYLPFIPRTNSHSSLSTAKTCGCCRAVRGGRRVGGSGRRA